MPPTMTKKELAFRFSPDLTYSGAISRLYRAIRDDPELRAALRKAHYRKSQRTITTQQMRVFEEFLL